MPELPDRPNLHQLRRQARELLRAATNGDPGAVARVHAVSGQVTLSAAQLALAREYGYRSWPVLKAEAERRRLSTAAVSTRLPGSDEPRSQDAPSRQWFFGEGAAIKTCAGVLSLDNVAVSGEGLLCEGVLHAALMPAEDLPTWPAVGSRRVSSPGMLFARWTRPRQYERIRQRPNHPAQAIFRALIRSGDIMVADDQGIRYVVRGVGMPSAGPPGTPLVGPISVGLRLDPVPGRQVAWIEVCGIDRSFRTHTRGSRNGHVRQRPEAT